MLVNNATKKALDRFIDSPTHGLLLSGPSGAGKLALARYIATRILGISDPAKLNDYPHYMEVQPIDGSVIIESVRDIHKFLKLVVPGDQSIRRIVIINQVNKMTIDAQNALLKALEEPPSDTVIILTAVRSLNIKETIYSRVQQISVGPVSEDDAIAFYKDSYSLEEIKKAVLLSNGRAGLLTSLLNDENHPMLAKIDEIKQILRQTSYERLLRVDALSKNREEASELIEAYKLVCESALRQSINSDSDKVTDWQARLKSAYTAEANLSHNPNLKLLLTDLLLSL